MYGQGTPRPFPAGTGSGAELQGRWSKLILWLGALMILGIALFTRGHDLDGGALSPDDGWFLRSARSMDLTPEVKPAKWLEEDRQWAKLLVLSLIHI